MREFDRNFKSRLSDSDGVPEGFDGMVRSRLASLPAREAEETAARPVARSMRRRVLAAVAAGTAVCLISGTALAASPALRELLWGGFEPYVQVLESTPENTQVYDGVEARIVSALSDGYANILHIELRDLDGDRVRDAWERYCETGENEFAGQVRFNEVIETAKLWEESLQTHSSFSMGGAEAGLAARPVDFDEETGVLTLRAALFTAAPARIERQARVEILTGLAGTKARTVRHETDGSWNRHIWEDGVLISEESGQGDAWDEPVVGWTLTAPLSGLGVRETTLDRVQVEATEAWRRGEHGANESIDPTMFLTSARVSQMGITLCRERDGMDETRMAPDELTVIFRDGGRQVLSGVWENHFYTHFEINGDAVNADTWLFPEPIDPDTVASVSLGGTEISLK